MQALQQAKGRSVTTAETLTPDRKTRSTLWRSVPVRLLVLIATTLGLGYLAYYAAVAYRRTATVPMAAKRPRSRPEAG